MDTRGRSSQLSAGFTMAADTRRLPDKEEVGSLNQHGFPNRAKIRRIALSAADPGARLVCSPLGPRSGSVLVMWTRLVPSS